MIQALRYWKQGLVVAFVIGAFGAGWGIRSTISDNEALQAKNDQLSANWRALENAHQQTIDSQKEVARIDQEYTSQLAARDAELDDIRANPQRVYISAACPDVPGAADRTGMGDGASARPSDAALRNYPILLGRIHQVTAQLTACQAILRAERADAPER